MKKVMNIVMAAFVVFAMASCGGGANTPEKVTEKFLSHLNKKEYAEAKKLGTEATGQYIDMIASLGDLGGAEEVKEPKIENIKCTEEAETAKCTYTSDGKEESLDLVKKDGKWLVDMKKETPDMDMDMDMDSDTAVTEETDDVVEENK